MTILYVYRQTIEFGGRPTHHVSFSETHPAACTLSRPVECLGKIELRELNYTERLTAPTESKDQ